MIIAGFRKLLEENPYFKVIGDFSTLEDLQGALALNDGSVSIVDSQMISIGDVAEIAGQSRLILSAMPEDIDNRERALKVGARGFLARTQSAVDIRKAVLSVGSGNFWISKTVNEPILSHQLLALSARTIDSDRIALLTTREKQVIQVACQGLKCRAIAVELRVSEPTIAHHLTSIYSKIGVKDRVGLIIYAFRHGLEVPHTYVLEP